MLLHKNMTLRWKGEEKPCEISDHQLDSHSRLSLLVRKREEFAIASKSLGLYSIHTFISHHFYNYSDLSLGVLHFFFHKTIPDFFFSNSKNNRRFDSSLFSQFRPRDGKTFCMHTYIHPWIGRNVFEETEITIHSNSYQHVVWNEKTSYAKRFPSTELRVILGVKLRRFSLFSSHYSLALLCWLLSDFLILFFVTH